MTHSSHKSELWQSNENTKLRLSRTIHFGLQLLSREIHLLSDLDIWHSDLFYSTQFLNYEANLVKFALFKMVNLIIQETSQIR